MLSEDKLQQMKDAARRRKERLTSEVGTNSGEKKGNIPFDSLSSGKHNQKDNVVESPVIKANHRYRTNQIQQTFVQASEGHNQHNEPQHQLPSYPNNDNFNDHGLDPRIHAEMRSSDQTPQSSMALKRSAAVEKEGREYEAEERGEDGKNGTIDARKLSEMTVKNNCADQNDLIQHDQVSQWGKRDKRSSTNITSVPENEQDKQFHSNYNTTGSTKSKHESENDQKNSSSLGSGLLSNEIRRLLHASDSQYNKIKRPVHRPHEDYERTIQRHLAFIDKLIEEKQELTDQCQKLAHAVEEIAKKSENKIKALQHKHTIELRSLGERLMKAESAKRGKWMETQKKKIKEATIRGLEPEIQRLIESHKQEIEELRQQHQKELASASNRDDAFRKRLKQELQLDLEAEKQREIADQIASTKAFYRKQIESLEEDIQQQRVKFKHQIETTEENSRQSLEEERKRLQAEIEEAWKTVHERERKARLDASQEIAALKARYEDDIRSIQKQAQIERESWEEILARKQRAEISTQVASIKDKLKAERDLEIEKVISRLEEEMATTHANLEASYNDRLAKLKETLKTSQTKCQDLEENLAAVEQENAQQISRLEQKISELDECVSSLTKERDEIGIKLQTSFDAKELEYKRRIHDLEKAVLDKQQTHDLDVSKMKHQHEKELTALKNEVEEALAKRDETIKSLHLEVQMAKRGISA